MRPHSALCAALLLAAPLFAQNARPGFSTEPLEYAPPLFAQTATLGESGESIVFDGTTIERVSFDGTLLQTYATLPGFGFPSFVELSTDGRYAAVGESSNGEIFLVDVAGGTVTSLGVRELNYDAAFAPDGTLFVSAAHLDSPSFNNLYRIDPSTPGAFVHVAQVPGFSGPVAVEANGDVLFGIAENPDRLIRYTQAQATSGALLGELDGALVSTDWSGLTQLVVDSKSGRIYAAEEDFVFFTDPARIHEVVGDKATSPVVYEADPGFSIGRMTLYSSGLNRAIFAPFQPERGGSLLFGQTDFFSSAELRILRPKRPQAVLTGPGVGGTGAVTYVATETLPNASILLFYGLTADNSSYEVPVPIGEIPHFWVLDPLSQTFLPKLFATDASGRMSFDFTNTGGAFTGLVTLQSVVVDGAGNLLGSTPPVSL